MGCGEMATSRRDKKRLGGEEGLTFEGGALAALALAEEEDLDRLSSAAILVVATEDAVYCFAALSGLLFCTETLFALLGRLIWRRLEGGGERVWF